MTTIQGVRLGKPLREVQVDPPFLPLPGPLEPMPMPAPAAPVEEPLVPA